MLVGVAEPIVAVPPETDKVKSAASKSPVPPEPLAVSYTFSLKVTTKRSLLEFIVVDMIVGFAAYAMLVSIEIKFSIIMVLINLKILDIFIMLDPLFGIFC